MKRIAIVGEIGSGKTFVAKLFGLPTFDADNEVNKIIETLEVVSEKGDIPSDTIRELIDFSYGSPGRYLLNLQHWLSISSPLRQKLEIQLSNQIELLQLAKAITDELNIEQQLWLIDFLQNRGWVRKKNSKLVKQLEARWDPEEKKWYVPEYKDRNLFKRWWPKNDSKPTLKVIK